MPTFKSMIYFYFPLRPCSRYAQTPAPIPSETVPPKCLEGKACVLGGCYHCRQRLRASSNVKQGSITRLSAHQRNWPMATPRFNANQFYFHCLDYSQLLSWRPRQRHTTNTSSTGEQREKCASLNSHRHRKDFSYTTQPLFGGVSGDIFTLRTHWRFHHVLTR